MDAMLEATALAEERHFWFRALRRNARYLLETALTGTTPRLIVDCGAGTGRNLDWLATLGPAVGVELSETGLRLGRAAGRRLIRGSVTRLPFADSCADVVTSFDVLYCLDDTATDLAVREMWRILKPNGIALVNTAALESLRGSHSALTNEVRRYTRSGLTALLAGRGFAVDRITFTNMATFPVVYAVRWTERVTGRANQASDADLRVPAAPVNGAVSVALAAESALLRLVNLPIGTSLMCVARKVI
jgi:SAM-dependent methyltransferase